MKTFENLKAFIINKPPIVLFTLAIVVVALGSVVVSLYIKNTDLIVVDTKKQEWNVFLDKLSALEFCLGPIQANEPQAKRGKMVSESAELNTVAYGVYYPAKLMRNFSFPISVTIHPTVQFELPNDLTMVTSLLDPAQMGVKGDGKASLLISSVIRIPPGASSCHVEPCRPTSIDTCLTLTVPVRGQPDYSDLIDQFQRNLNACITSTNYTLAPKLWADMSPSSFSSIQTVRCPSGPILSLRHSSSLNPVIYMSVMEKSVINMHLFFTSFFLFIMVFMIMIFALFRGRSSKAGHDLHHLPKVGGLGISKVLINIPLFSEQGN